MLREPEPASRGSHVPRRVAIVSDWCPPRRGGIEVHIVSLARHLRQAGIDVTIVTSYPGPTTVDGITVDRVPTLLLPAAKVAISPRLVAITEARIRGRYDLVHVHSSQVAPFGLAAAIAARRLGLPVVATFHSFMGILPQLLSVSDRLFRWSEGRTAITAVSGHVARQITQVMPDLNVNVLPNGFDRAAWPETQMPPATRGPLRVVSAMRLQRRKRPGALLDIFKRARALAGPVADGMTLTVAGDGPEKAGLERRFRRAGLDGSVHLAGWLAPEELRRLYQSADLFLMPSTKEAFCIAALEARACGLPVLGMANTGISEFVADGVSGELAHGDEDMAARLAAMARDRDRLAALAAANAGLDRYDWTNLAAEHIAFYRALCARGQVAMSRT